MKSATIFPFGRRTTREQNTLDEVNMPTSAMPTANNIATWIDKYFHTHRIRTAEVLSGPKRETWFSAETYVALCGEISPHPENPDLPNFSCWGELEFATVFASLERGCPSVGAPKRKPDIVCYNVSEGIEAVEAVIEIKLVRNDENANACLAELKEQLSNAALLFPYANILGIVFFAMAPYKTPGTFNTASKRLKQGIERIFPEQDGFTVVSEFKVHPIFDAVPTRFHFPQMSASLSLAVLQFRSGVASPI
jgi:hypothetical protein